MDIVKMGLPSRAVKALTSKGILTAESLIEYINTHPGWCHSDAYPSNIKGIGTGTAGKVLDGLLDTGLIDKEWHERQLSLTTKEGYDSLFVHVARNRKRPGVNL